ncbi:hypothetical protein FA13DRAFT_1514280 [Coprinellus micaceus]|uniref:F-box domain-containing protein n=1 Tax=Coprinellus micaceus TaxID=71717 RepID=A0A4Y7SKH4_COPMI|nr:hypothetical protein FA13DRAFT_1514280 [Coprinellus micaceus]
MEGVDPEERQRRSLSESNAIPSPPVHRIPPEILHEIFCLATPSLKFFQNAKELLNIGLVCQSWRAVMSAQWAQLGVTARVGKPIPSKKILAWFANAGDSPKTLNLRPPFLTRNTCACRHSSAECSWASVGLPALLLEIPQLEKLALKFTSASCFKTLIRAMEAQATASGPRRSSWFSLRSLYLDF